MLSALFPIPAAQIVGRAVTITTPADALGMRGPFRYPSDHVGWRYLTLRSTAYRAMCTRLLSSQGIYGSATRLAGGPSFAVNATIHDAELRM
jgi:hypothetical protein